jgi:hypothetical protein
MILASETLSARADIRSIGRGERTGLSRLVTAKWQALRLAIIARMCRRA